MHVCREVSDCDLILELPSIARVHVIDGFLSHLPRASWDIIFFTFFDGSFVCEFISDEKSKNAEYKTGSFQDFQRK